MSKTRLFLGFFYKIEEWMVTKELLGLLIIIKYKLNTNSRHLKMKSYYQIQ